MSVLPSLQAMASAVNPSWSTAFTLGPCRSRRDTMWGKFPRTATRRGVQEYIPVLSTYKDNFSNIVHGLLISTWAPAPSRASTISTLPFLHAQMSGVVPYLSPVSTLAPWCSSTFMRPTWSFPAAHTNPVQWCIPRTFTSEPAFSKSSDTSWSPRIEYYLCIPAAWQHQLTYVTGPKKWSPKVCIFGIHCGSLLNKNFAAPRLALASCMDKSCATIIVFKVQLSTIFYHLLLYVGWFSIGTVPINIKTACSFPNTHAWMRADQPSSSASSTCTCTFRRNPLQESQMFKRRV